MLHDALVTGFGAAALLQWGAGKLPLGLSVFAAPLTVVHELATNTAHESSQRTCEDARLR